MNTLPSATTNTLRGLPWPALVAVVLVALLSLVCKVVSLLGSVLVLATDAVSGVADARVTTILAGRPANLTMTRAASP